MIDLIKKFDKLINNYEQVNGLLTLARNGDLDPDEYKQTFLRIYAYLNESNDILKTLDPTEITQEEVKEPEENQHLVYKFFNEVTGNSMFVDFERGKKLFLEVVDKYVNDTKYNIVASTETSLILYDKKEDILRTIALTKIPEDMSMYADDMYSLIQFNDDANIRHIRINISRKEAIEELNEIKKDNYYIERCYQPIISSDTMHLIFRVDSQGDERWQLWLIVPNDIIKHQIPNF